MRLACRAARGPPRPLTPCACPGRTGRAGSRLPGRALETRCRGGSRSRRGGTSPAPMAAHTSQSEAEEARGLRTSRRLKAERAATSRPSWAVRRWWVPRRWWVAPRWLVGAAVVVVGADRRRRCLRRWRRGGGGETAGEQVGHTRENAAETRAASSAGVTGARAARLTRSVSGVVRLMASTCSPWTTAIAWSSVAVLPSSRPSDSTTSTLFWAPGVNCCPAVTTAS